jgi:hypothetical protein
MATTKQVNKTSSPQAATKVSSAKNVEVSLKNKVEDVVGVIENAADDVQEKTESVLASTKGVAKQLWFANLGVYGRAFEEAQTRYTKLASDRQQLVSDLVSRGEKVQDDAGSLIKESRNILEDQVEKVSARFAKVAPLLDVNANMKKLSERLASLRNTFKKAA